MNSTVMIVAVVYMIILVISGLVAFSFIRHLRNKSRLTFIERFADFVSVFQYYLDKAYQIVYKDHILIYSLEATKPSDEQFSTAAKTFTQLVLKLLGPNLTRDFINLHGSEETLLFNITEYFNDRYENDEIRKQSMEDIMEKELDSEG